MRRAPRIDANQRMIVAGLRCIPGVSVFSTAALGNGFVDVVVGYKGTNYMLEIKDGAKAPSERKLTPAEQRFHDEWRGQVAMVETLADCLRVMGVTG